MEKDAIPVSEFCKNFGISYGTFLNMLHKGQAPATFKVGNKRWVRLSVLEQWITDQEKAA